MVKDTIPENKEPADEPFASLIRSINEASSSFQSLALESARRAVEIQFQLIGKAFDTYISQMSKFGSSSFASSSTVDVRRPEQSDSTRETKAAQQPPRFVEAKLQPGRPAAAQGLTTKRKSGTVAKSQSVSQRSKKKSKGRNESIRRGKN